MSDRYGSTLLQALREVHACTNSYGVAFCNVGTTGSLSSAALQVLCFPFASLDLCKQRWEVPFTSDENIPIINSFSVL